MGFSWSQGSIEDALRVRIGCRFGLGWRVNAKCGSEARVWGQAEREGAESRV